MYDGLLSALERLVYQPEGGMVHPGLPPQWVAPLLLGMAALVLWSLRPAAAGAGTRAGVSLLALPWLRSLLRPAVRRPWLLVSLRLLSAGVFLLVIYAGLMGTQVPERNIATMLTWTVWWSAVVISVLFVGSAWCAVCPWDALATWLVRRRLWRRNDGAGLNLRVPRQLRNIWPALGMFVGLTWLELGLGVTTSPYATALLALLMVVLATVSLALFERKAFCRYFCAVGRTLGAYGGMSPVALRPVDPEVCARCTTLECYHGTREVEPCPTHLVMGRMSQNTYCTSCGACAQSCPHGNVGWRVRPLGTEVLAAARPHWDEAWFALGLLALTTFHGITMMPYWESWMSRLAVAIGDSGRLLGSFSLGMAAAMAAPLLVYAVAVAAARRLGRLDEEYRRVFAALAFAALPLAFSYHVAHNLTHLVRESHGFWSVLANPLGAGTLPPGMAEIHFRHMNPLLPNEWVHALQAGLVLFGFWLALRVVVHRLQRLVPVRSRLRGALLPLVVFITMVSLANLWLLMQPMVMRM